MYLDDLGQTADNKSWLAGNPPKDGSLEITLEDMSVHSSSVLHALITFIAATYRGVSLNPNYTITVPYNCDTCWQSNIDWPTVNLTTIGSFVEVIFTEDDKTTNGAIDLQHM
jgi:hypothetical protein